MFENYLTVSYDQTLDGKLQLNNFIKKVKGKETDFTIESIFPTPPELQGLAVPPEIVSDINEILIKGYDPRFGRPITLNESNDLITKYGFNNWYDWRIENWGIKWDIELFEFKPAEGKVEYSFLSPCNPPLRFLFRVSTLYPLLLFHLRYCERELGSGEVYIKNGGLC